MIDRSTARSYTARLAPEAACLYSSVVGKATCLLLLQIWWSPPRLCRHKLQRVFDAARRHEGFLNRVLLDDPISRNVAHNMTTDLYEDERQWVPTPHGYMATLPHPRRCRREEYKYGLVLV